MEDAFWFIANLFAGAVLGGVMMTCTLLFFVKWLERKQR